MKSSSVMTICIILFTLNSVYSQYTSKIRVMTYNINAEKHASGSSYIDISQVIKTINAQINGLQKIDSCNSRNPDDVLKWLGEQTEKTYSFAPAIKNYQGSSGSYGVGFLTTATPLANRKLWIEHTANEQDRSVLEISITMGGEKVRVIVTHLAHEGTTFRTAQINKIIPWIDSVSSTDPVIIMADFNALPSESSMKLFENAGFSYVKGKDGSILDTSANQKINHILYRPTDRWVVTDAQNPYYSASNRNPVWADMELLNPVSIPGHHSHSSNKAILYSGLSIVKNKLNYCLTNDADISISIYSISGKKITVLKNSHQKKGNHTIKIAPGNITHGLYHCLLHINGVTTTAEIMYMN